MDIAIIMLRFGNTNNIFADIVCVFIYWGRPECTSYTVLEDSSRATSFGDGTNAGSSVNGKYRCDREGFSGFSGTEVSPGWRGPAWYRFTMPAGTRIPESSPGPYHCGTVYTGWLSGVHPTSPGASIKAKFCFDWGSNDCGYSTQGKVTNCGSYFVYYLENTHVCNIRYCATN